MNLVPYLPSPPRVGSARDGWRGRVSAPFVEESLKSTGCRATYISAGHDHRIRLLVGRHHADRRRTVWDTVDEEVPTRQSASHWELDDSLPDVYQVYRCEFVAGRLQCMLTAKQRQVTMLDGRGSLGLGSPPGRGRWLALPSPHNPAIFMA
jgi:hypothetical protein